MNMLGLSERNANGELRKYAIPAKRIGCTAEEYATNKANGLAWCSHKKHWVPVKDFSVTRSGRRYNYCIDCQQSYRRKSA